MTAPQKLLVVKTISKRGEVRYAIYSQKDVLLVTQEWNDLNYIARDVRNMIRHAAQSENARGTILSYDVLELQSSDPESPTASMGSEDTLFPINMPALKLERLTRKEQDRLWALISQA